MWVPLLSKDPISAERHILEQLLIRGGRANSDVFEHHEVYLIKKHPTTLELTYEKIMDARYAQLRSAEDQLQDV